MTNRTALVVTSIAAPNDILKSLAAGAQLNGWTFYVIGDAASPADFSLAGARFLSVEDQLATGLAIAARCPLRHYARKNIGYLLAMRDGAQVIVESDDDNRPLEEFWTSRRFAQNVRVLRDGGWTNVYGYFSDDPIWPRGLPLEFVRRTSPDFDSLPEAEAYCPIQQGLADGDPDVDAIYRLTMPLPGPFRRGRRVAISQGTWCPFNSQNTSWARDAFPLMYLPAYCSFRMTDIWRSFVAQRIALENGWAVLFDEANVCQERNEHDLMRDFRDEIPGYLNNRAICERLAEVAMRPGVPALAENLLRCYEALIAAGFLDKRELAPLEAWISDLDVCGAGC
ncbi:MAG TPA: STELLO glycosyltransferase family protein [Bryobacteraceae bacterium]|nr:STELLO glycosyltransferase family protein [Bryobacteraceae bacterium]